MVIGKKVCSKLNYHNEFINTFYIANYAGDKLQRKMIQFVKCDFKLCVLKLADIDSKIVLTFRAD